MTNTNVCGTEKTTKKVIPTFHSTLFTCMILGFTAVEMNYSVIWVVTLHKVVWYGCFGTVYRPHLEASRCL